MVSNVDRIYVTRRSRSRTPSRVATPLVKKSKPAKKKAPARASTRARSKTPTRTITASTPKPKASAKKPTTAKSTEKIPRKRKSIVLRDDDDDDEVDYPVKKANSPKTPKTPKPTGRPKNSPAGSTEKVRRSRRLRDQNTNSILEKSVSRRESKASRDLSINGGVSTSQNETLNDEQGRKWGWFSCAIM